MGLYETLAKHGIPEERQGLYVNAIEDLQTAGEDFDEALIHWLDARSQNRERTKAKTVIGIQEIHARITKAVEFLETELITGETKKERKLNLSQAREEIDKIAVERVVSGDVLQLSREERIEAVDRMLSLGVSEAAMSHRLCILPRQVSRYKKELRDRQRKGESAELQEATSA